MFKYCYNCWEKNELDSNICISCGNPLNDNNLNSKIEEAQKLFDDKKLLLKHGVYGLLFAEKTLNANFNEKTEYTKLILQIIKNIENEIDNPKTLKSEDITEYNSSKRCFSLEKIDVKSDLPQINLLKVLPLTYLESINGKIKDNSNEGPFENEKDNRYYSLFNLLNENPPDKYYNYLFVVLSKFISFIIHQSDEDKLKELKRLSDTFSFILSLIDGNEKLDHYRAEKYLEDVLKFYKENSEIKRIFEGSRSIHEDDVSKVEGIVNTFFAIVHALNQNKFEECIKTAILNENELRVTTALTGIIAGCYYHIDENFNMEIPILKKNSVKPDIKKSYNEWMRYTPFESNPTLTFKNIFVNPKDFEIYLNNFENIIMKDQIRVVTRFRDAFKDLKESDCYDNSSIYPNYPKEMHTFSLSTWILEDSRYVHSNYEKVYSKYGVERFSGDYDEKRKKLIKIADFNSLKIMLNEYLRAEHMCEGWWAHALEEKIFYQIILRLEEYSNFINIQNLEVPELLFDFSVKNKSIENITKEKDTTQNSPDIEKQNLDKEQITILPKKKSENISKSALFEEHKDDILITLVGTNFYYGNEPFEIGTKLELIKEPDNDYDTEAIYVKSNKYGKVAYVANNIKTVHKNTYSAGRLYDKIGDSANIEIIYIDENEIIAKINK